MPLSEPKTQLRENVDRLTGVNLAADLRRMEVPLAVEQVFRVQAQFILPLPVAYCAMKDGNDLPVCPSEVRSELQPEAQLNRAGRSKLSRQYSKARGRLQQQRRVHKLRVVQGIDQVRR